ncbi:MAG: NAD-dependent deacylase [Pseudobacteriovorax sp.]|nr:NAD-dependent deacylase [Pseudobacteriovorax sp.]
MTTFSYDFRHPFDIIVLTGAGISAKSGIATFRDSGGLWENHKIEDVCTPNGFEKNPALVYQFYNQRRRQLLDPKIQPNPAHRALTHLGQAVRTLIVTQNVDDLHERADNQNVVHIHGELLQARCTACHAVHEVKEDFDAESVCSHCQTKGSLRPNIVWFGEMPMHLASIYQALAQCKAFIAIGTSGQVYPAAGFVAEVSPGCITYEVNQVESEFSRQFQNQSLGPASIKVPELVEHLIDTFGN